MKVDMSPESVTTRLRTMDELWLLSVKLMNSRKVASAGSVDHAEYWRGIVARLRTDSNWAAHVLATGIDEDDSNLNQALKYVNKEEIIENTIRAYEDWSAQPYCDEILAQFDKRIVANIYGQIENPSQNLEKGVSRFLNL